jgi:hypothetical protein
LQIGETSARRSDDIEDSQRQKDYSISTAPYSVTSPMSKKNAVGESIEISHDTYFAGIKPGHRNGCLKQS